jgi:WD40 repeat protein
MTIHSHKLPSVLPLIWTLSCVLILAPGPGCHKQRQAQDRSEPSQTSRSARPAPGRAGIGLSPAALAKALTRRHTLAGHELGVEGLAFSPNSRLLASGSEDKTVKVWDLGTGKPTRTFKGHEQWVTAVAYHPTDQLVVSGSGDKTLRISRVNRKTKARIIKEHRGVRSVAFSPDGKLIASGAFGGEIRLWHVGTGDWRHTLKAHGSDVYAVAFDPGSKILASGGADRKIHLWSVSSGKSIRLLEGHTEPVRLVAFTPDGTKLRSVGADRTLRTWDVTTGKQLSSVTLVGGTVRAAALSPDGAMALVAVGRHAQLVDFATGRVLRSFPPGKKPIFSVAFSPDGRTVAWAGASATVEVWSTRPR